MRAIAYIDGYNWYHTVFKHYPEWKWLNCQSFFESLRPHDDVFQIKLFSAMIRHDPGAEERQKRYFDALLTLPKVQVILGVFQPREVTCRADCRLKYTIQEEKKTDVNLAIEILNDAFTAKCQRMIIVSGDSDIQPAIEWVCRNRRQVRITVYVPALPQEQSARRLDYYRTRGLDVECRFLPLCDIQHHQLKGCVKLADGTFAARPHLWARTTH